MNLYQIDDLIFYSANLFNFVRSPLWREKCIIMLDFYTMYQNQMVFFDITLYLCSIYSDLVIHMFLKEGKLAKMLPPSQHMVSLLGGARHLHLASVGKVLFIYLINLSGNPSIIVFPPASTISL